MDHPGRAAEIEGEVGTHTENRVHFKGQVYPLGFLLLFLTASALNKNGFSIPAVNQLNIYSIFPTKYYF